MSSSVTNLPAGWTTRTLGDCAIWYSGGTPRTSVKEYWDGDIPWITASSLHDFYIRDSERKVTELGVRNGTRLMPENTILFVVRGMSLKSEFRVGIARRPVTFGQDCKAIIAREGVDPMFLANALRARKQGVLRLVSEASHGTGRLETEPLKQLEIALPPLPIQRRIAEILGRLDDKIETNRRINRTLEAMAQALYQHWFVDFGPFQAGEFVESELGLIPQGWTTTTLKEITTKIGSGATPRGGSSVYVDEGIHLIRSQNVYDSTFSWDGLARITDEAADKLSNVTVVEGDVLINITGDSILRTCVTDCMMLPARVNQHVAIIRPAPDIPAHFIHQHLLRPETKEMLLNMSSGATRKAITKGNLESTKILLPPICVLDEFRSKTDPFFAQISINNCEALKLTEIRDYLLPKLLSGEIAVAVIGES